MCHPDSAGRTSSEASRPTTRVSIPLAGDVQMPALLASPSTLPAMGVVVATDYFGPTAFYEELAGRLAEQGYIALVPDYFLRVGALSELTREAANGRMQALDDRRAVADLAQAARWLREYPQSTGFVATLGFCLGGTLVLHLAAEGAGGTGTVCYYGFPRSDAGASSLPQPLDRVAQMKGPILGHWGDADQAIDLETVEEFDRVLVDAGVDHEFHVYPGVGHGFLRAHLGGGPGPEATAAEHSWLRTLDFLQRVFATDRS